ncbi:sigma 54-interacting transcriptional regulator [bacterium]|nr:sigma 54-interacting transcriptional regulator [bacterium]MCI0606330.1 sigma 54-interacting transcriptional regulator [bacterium]
MQTRMEQGGHSGKEIPVRLTQTLRTLLKFSRTLAEAADEYHLLQSVCNIFVENFGFRIAWVGYAEADPQKTIRRVAQAGDNDGILLDLDLTWAEADSKQPASMAIRTGQTCSMPDIHMLSLPLKSASKAFGALTLYTDDPRQFERDNVKLLEEWSDIFAHAVITSRHAVLRAQALRRSEAYLSEAQRLSLTGSFGWNVSSGELFWSDETYRIVGLDRMIRPTFEQVLQRIHPEDVVFVKQTLERAVRQNTDLDFEHRFLMQDGSIKHVHVVAHASKQETGSVEYVGAVTDVTATKLAEEKTRKNERELRQIIEAISPMIVVLAPEGHFLYANEQVLEYTGCTLEQVAADDFRERVLHPEDFQRLLEERQQALSLGVPFEKEQRIRRKDGQYRWFLTRLNPLFDERGNIIRWYGTGIDIHDRKQTEDKIRQDERELREIVEAIPQLISVLTPDGRLLYANQKVLDYTGCTQEDAIAPGFRERVIHPEDVDRLTDERQQSLSRGVPFEIEQRVLRKDGKYRWFLARFNPVRDEQGHVIRWYLTAIDINDRKEVEEKVRKENIALREEIDKTSMFEEIVGVSQSLQTVLSRVSKVAPTNSTVLIHGETGTGKELIARAIHKRSERFSRAFVSVNCAAIPSSLIASELFGHEKGAFTGAVQRRLGRFELAEGGTIFLDEIGELPQETQIALLRVLQEREFERVGGTQRIRADVRVITATNRDLQAAIAAGTFRSDLFYRLNVVPFEMPPLRERSEDIPLLMEYFIDRYASKAGKKIRSVNKRTLDLFQSYSWPGNVRELQNVIERSLIFCDTDTFSVDESWLSPQSISIPETSQQLSETLATREKQMIEAAMADAEGRVSGPSGAAAKLGIPASTLYRKIKLLKINKHRFKNT